MKHKVVMVDIEQVDSSVYNLINRLKMKNPVSVVIYFSSSEQETIEELIMKKERFIKQTRELMPMAKPLANIDPSYRQLERGNKRFVNHK